MPTAATVTDVEDYLGRDLSADTARIERLITRAEGIVAGDMPGLTFGAGTETVTLYGDADEVLWLPKYPVTAVTSVTIDGVALVAGDYTVGTLGNLRRLSSSISDPQLSGTPGLWPDAGTAIVVTYDYGISSSACPPELSAVVTELVAGRVANPEQLTQESMGDRSHSYAAPAAAGAGDSLSAGQRNRLRHWRRFRFASARIRP